MKKNKISGVYVIRNLLNGRLYVGSSVNLYQRNKAHFLELTRSVHHNFRLQFDFNMQGQKAFVFEVLEKCLPNDLPQREKYYIDTLNALDPIQGYNIQPVPYKGIIPEEVSRLISLKKTGRKLSKRAKKKIGDFHRGKVISAESRAKMSASRLGFKQSEATKQKCRLIHLGVKKTKEQRIRMSANRPHKKPVICFDDDQNMMACFESIGEAAREMGIVKKSIQQVCRGLKQHTGGMRWQYA